MALLAAGCGFQSKIIEARQSDLNETIRATNDEQLLLNLVRLRYDETPFFLQIAGVTTSFAAGASAGVSGSFPQNAGNVLGANAGISYSEAPTVTWSLPDSREFFGRLNTPMGADQLTVLTQAGLDPALVLRVGVRKMNRLRNLEYDVRDGVYEPATFPRFVEALELIETLRREDLVDLAYGVYSTAVAGKIPLSKLDTRAIPDGLAYGMQFMTRDNPKVFEPLRMAKPLFLRFSRRADSDPRAQRLRTLLDLDPTRYSFAIIDTASSGTEGLLAEGGRLSRVFDTDKKLREIVVNNRSVVEILRFASTYVEAPSGDLSRGIVRARTSPGTSWLRIHTASSDPGNAWIKVQRDGAWFYIAEDDLDSRVAFTLLNAIFSSVVGQVPGAKPLLTLPVK